MKRNVDLTEQRIFTTPEEPTGIFKLILDQLNSIKPWDLEKEPISNEEMLENRNRLIPVGNRKDREAWRLNCAYERDQICDRCGQDRGKLPWARKTCNCYSMTYKPKVPWRF